MKDFQSRVLPSLLALLLAAGAASPASAAKTSRKKKAAKAHKSLKDVRSAPVRPRAASKGDNFLKLGMVHLDRDEYTPAIDRFNQAVQAEGTAAGYFLLGWAHYQRGFLAGTPEAADKQDAQ